MGRDNLHRDTRDATCGQTSGSGGMMIQLALLDCGSGGGRRAFDAKTIIGVHTLSVLSGEKRVRDRGMRKRQKTTWNGCTGGRRLPACTPLAQVGGNAWWRLTLPFFAVLWSPPNRRKIGIDIRKEWRQKHGIRNSKQACMP